MRENKVNYRNEIQKEISTELQIEKVLDIIFRDEDEVFKKECFQYHVDEIYDAAKCFLLLKENDEELKYFFETFIAPPAGVTDFLMFKAKPINFTKDAVRKNLIASYASYRNGALSFDNLRTVIEAAIKDSLSLLLCVYLLSNPLSQTEDDSQEASAEADSCCSCSLS